MSYDFRLCLPQQGKTLEEIALADSEEIGAGEPDPVKEERKRIITEALVAKNPDFEPFALGFEQIAASQGITVEDAKKKFRYIELNGPEDGNGIQVTLFDDEASVTVPYWHKGDRAKSVFEEIWRYLRTIEEKGGCFTYDPQLERILDLNSDFAGVLKFYLRVSVDIAKRLPASRSKKWWELWK
jgi:hypothetical protein